MLDIQPPPGTLLEVAPGVFWARMPLPFALDHINLWLLRDDRDGQPGWTVVDCGIHRPETLQAWEGIFDTQLGGLSVLGVIVTHLHPDHIGNAAWISQRWSDGDTVCKVWISAGEFFCAHHVFQRSGDSSALQMADFFARHGLTDAEAQAKLRQRGNYYGSLVPTLPATFVRLQRDMSLRIGDHAWTCIDGYGHSPEHMSLYCEALGVLISGDMLLPRISTNVSVTDLEPEADPLALYLASIARLGALPPDTLVLPSHGKPFYGLHARVDQLVAHHDERLALTLRACETAPTSAADLLPVLFRRELDLHQTTFAMGEALAHLHALWLRGKLARRLDADRIYRFTTV